MCWRQRKRNAGCFSEWVVEGSICIALQVANGVESYNEQRRPLGDKDEPIVLAVEGLLLKTS